MTPGKGSKYQEFYDLSGRITCMKPLPNRAKPLLTIYIVLLVTSVAILNINAEKS